MRSVYVGGLLAQGERTVLSVLIFKYKVEVMQEIQKLSDVEFHFL